MDTRIAIHAKLTQVTHATKCWSAKGPKGDWQQEVDELYMERSWKKSKLSSSG
jgi:hypothetical protein